MNLDKISTEPHSLTRFKSNTSPHNQSILQCSFIFKPQRRKETDLTLHQVPTSIAHRTITILRLYHFRNKKKIDGDLLVGTPARFVRSLDLTSK